MAALKDVPTYIRFPTQEEEILEYWQQIDAFRTSLKRSEGRPEYTFYDGPPFATGLPHYGHLLAGTIKDIVTRYAHQTGHHVERRFGWDCVAAGTPVSTGLGFALPIDYSQIIDTPVLAYDAENGGIVHSTADWFFDQGTRKCVRLLFEDGRELVCTPEHRIMTTSGWMKVRDLPLRDSSVRVLVGADQPAHGSEFIDDDPACTWSLDVGPYTFRWNSITERFRTAAFASLLGLLLSDSTVFRHFSGRGETVAQAFLKHEMDVIQTVAAIKAVTGITPKSRFIRTRNIHVVDFPLELTDPTVSTFGLHVGARIENAAALPEFLSSPHCPVGVIREFLAGMFGGDGQAPQLAAEKNGRLSIQTLAQFTQSRTNKLRDALCGFMSTMKGLLVRVGIADISLDTPRETAATSKKRRRDGETDTKFEQSIVIGQSSMTAFAEKVGFRFCSHKQARLAAVCAYHRMNARIDADNLKILRKMHELKSTTASLEDAFTAAVQAVQDEGVLSLAHLITFDEARQYPVKAPDAYTTRGLIQPDLWLEQVGAMPLFVDPHSDNKGMCDQASCENLHQQRTFGLQVVGRQTAGEWKVYDIRVPGHHSFVAGGVVVHNCHGLPIEFEIEKKLGIKTREQVLAMGIDKYNEECRSIVMRFSSEWRRVVNRMGRWIDFDNDYKTMNTNYMESVWWVIKQLFEKGLVYRGFKVMPFSTSCTTPLSNFEANMNYKEVQDPAVMITFPLEEDSAVKLVAWTTTPWTLPSNLALCLNPDMEYVKIEDFETHNIYVVAECRLGELYKPRKGPDADKLPYKVIARFKGSELAGKHYVPLFDYFARERANNAFVIMTDNYVTSDSGTGVVHCAPGFGEDDFRVCMKWGVIKKGDSVPCPLDFNGRFTNEVPDYQGIYCKDTDKLIIKRLKENGRLIHQSTISHNYPFCWRSDSPLIYRAIPGWFVAVEQFKDKLLINNKKSYWVPDWVQDKRFHNWLETAIDWSISRNRYWGTPLPLWVSDDFEEVVCIGSVAELEELSGVKGITDLHRHKIDHITIPSRKGKGTLRRVEEVADCWLESGSMPYAQVHYPFENKDRFEKSFPADFIAEGIDQTRGWFYTLLVLGTALFDQCPFKNLIVNGLVLAKDGKKMSKSLRNYPDPNDVIHSHGADALRLYLINSPIVRAENLRFNEDGVRDIVRDVFLPWFNAYRFFVQNVTRFNNKHPDAKFVPVANLTPTNVMDRWILSVTHSLIKFVRAEMDAYHLYTVVPRLLLFINQLTNWYVRMNRKRSKGSGNSVEDWTIALSVLFEVLVVLVRLMAPFTPFLTEAMYQNLKALSPEAEDSVHYTMLPVANDKYLDKRIEESIANMQMVVEMARSTRDKRRIGLKTPLPSVTVIHKDLQFLQDVIALKDYIVDEVNVKQLEVTSDEGAFVTKSFVPDAKLLGSKFKKDFKLISDALKTASTEDVTRFQEQGFIDVLNGKFRLVAEELRVNRQFRGDMKNFESASNDSGVLVLVNYNIDPSLINEGLAREIVNRIQHLRKQAGLNPEDKINVYYSDSALNQVIESMHNYINESLNVATALRPLTQMKEDEVLVINDNEVKVGDAQFALRITRA